MKSRSSDLAEKTPSVGRRVKRIILPPKKLAPAPGALRGWAKSSIKSRNKS
jgi:hypothetical protein